jgi:hypothetical protein
MGPGDQNLTEPKSGIRIDRSSTALARILVLNLKWGAVGGLYISAFGVRLDRSSPRLSTDMFQTTNFELALSPVENQPVQLETGQYRLDCKTGHARQWRHQRRQPCQERR